MRRFCPIVAAVLIALLPVLFASSQQQTPTLVFESQTKDFGRVGQGLPLKHVFKFTNKGSAVLEIFKVEGS